MNVKSQPAILVVDDVEFNRRVVVELLRQSGFTARAASSGREAVDLCNAEAFDVILMDVNMPEMNGLEATRRIRGIEKTKSAGALIIGVSAHCSEQELASFLSAGMDTCLPKPIDLDRLLTTIESVGHVEDVEGDDQGTCEATGEWPVLDYSGALRRIGGNRELFQRFVEIFREDAPPLLDNIRDAAASGNWTAARDAAHRLRGMAANLGAVALTEAARQFESSCDSGESGDDSEGRRHVNEIARQSGLLESSLREVV